MLSTLPGGVRRYVVVTWYDVVPRPKVGGWQLHVYVAIYFWKPSETRRRRSASSVYAMGEHVWLRVSEEDEIRERTGIYG